MTTGARETVCVVGAGYVGLTTAVCLAETGHDVRLVEIDAARLAVLGAGRAPIHEPGVDELLTAALRCGRLRVGADLIEAMAGASIAVIAVGTPPEAGGDADLSQVRSALAGVAGAAESGTIVVIKSSVPPGTTVRLQPLVRRGRRRLLLVTCPEFLREGEALRDFHHPARVVVGGDDPAACRRVAALFAAPDSKVILTDFTSAELIKYGANAFLALKISFINELAQLCESTGADVEAVADGVGSDPRIGRAFLSAGLGFGGSCFPKDVRALEETASYHGHSFWLLKAAVEVNAQQRRRFVAKIAAALHGRLAGRRVAVLGLAFKPGTDDMRQAASIDIVRHLVDLGATVCATDPVALERARAALPGVEMVEDPYACVQGADAIAVITEWPQYRDLDWTRIAQVVRRPLVIDGRNCLDGEALGRLGFTYVSVGRRSVTPPRGAPSPVSAA